MAPWGTRATRRRYGEVDREFPSAGSEGDLFTDVEGLFRCVDLVAGSAGPPFLLIDMQTVQVLFTITEACDAET